MRPAAPLLLACACALAVAAGCSSSNKGKLEDTRWESLPVTIRNVEFDRGARVLEFKKDELVYAFRDANGLERTLTGKWAYNAGPYVTLTFDQPLNDRKRHVEKIVVSPEGDRLTMTDSDGTAVTFARAAPPMPPSD